MRRMWLVSVSLLLLLRSVGVVGGGVVAGENDEGREMENENEN